MASVLQARGPFTDPPRRNRPLSLAPPDEDASPAHEPVDAPAMPPLHRAASEGEPARDRLAQPAGPPPAYRRKRLLRAASGALEDAQTALAGEGDAHALAASALREYIERIAALLAESMAVRCASVLLPDPKPWRRHSRLRVVHTAARAEGGKGGTGAAVLAAIPQLSAAALEHADTVVVDPKCEARSAAAGGHASARSHVLAGKSALAVPLTRGGEEVIGVLLLLDRVQSMNLADGPAARRALPFEAADVLAVEAVAAQLGSLLGLAQAKANAKQPLDVLRYNPRRRASAAAEEPAALPHDHFPASLTGRSSLELVALGTARSAFGSASARRSAIDVDSDSPAIAVTQEPSAPLPRVRRATTETRQASAALTGSRLTVL